MARHEEKDAKREKKDKSHHKEKSDHKDREKDRSKHKDKSRDKERKEKHRSREENGDVAKLEPSVIAGEAQIARPVAPVSKDQPDVSKSRKRDRDEAEDKQGRTEPVTGNEEVDRSKRHRTSEADQAVPKSSEPLPGPPSQQWKVEDSGKESSMSIDETNR